MSQVPHTAHEAASTAAMHPCIVHGPGPWQPLSRAQILLMAIELRRMRAIAESVRSAGQEES